MNIPHGDSEHETYLILHERHAANLIEVSLKRQGYAVVSTFTVDRALAALDLHPPTKALLDADTGGYAILEKIRSNPLMDSIWVALFIRKARREEFEAKPYQPDQYVEYP